MNIIKALLLVAILGFSNSAYSSEVIPPGIILTNIATNKPTIKELKIHWALDHSALSKNISEKEQFLALKLLQDIDIKSIKSEQWEDKTQIVKSNNGDKLIVKFKYTKHDYGPNDIALSGTYSIISITALKP